MQQLSDHLLYKEINPRSEVLILTQVKELTYQHELRMYNFYEKLSSKHGGIFSQILAKRALFLQKLSLNIEVYDKNLLITQNLMQNIELSIANEIKSFEFYNKVLPLVEDVNLKDLMYQIQANSYNEFLPSLRFYLSSLQNPKKNEDNLKKINELANLAKKFSEGKANEEDISSFLKSFNLSFLSGLITGGAGSVFFNK